jgi:hypothetical protein
LNLLERKRKQGVMKREIEQADGVAAEGSRPKRRKEGAGNSSDTEMPAGVAANGNEGSGQIGEGLTTETVKDQGLRLWQIVKDAVNKECVPFLPYSILGSFIPTTLLFFPTTLKRSHSLYRIS